jgi:hypothetical protein
MSKYGSPSVKLFLIGGRSVLSATTEITGPEEETLTEETTPFGADWFEHVAIGIRKVAFGAGGWYDDEENAANEAHLNGQLAEQVACFGIEGNTIGKKFIGLAGVFAAKYARAVTRNGLHRANCEMRVTGQLDNGVILQPWEQKSVDWNTEATSVDNGASSANGGVAYQQVSELTGLTGFVSKIRHSADNATFADLVTFANVTAAPAAERKTVAGTVNRYLAYDGNVTGTGTITPMAGFARG